MGSSGVIEEQLQALDFHDSALSEVAISFSDGNRRSCSIVIDYYDWEGNSRRREVEPTAPWRWRRLKLTFGYLAHIEFSAPDLVNRAQDINSVTLGYDLASLQLKHQQFKKNFPQGSFPIFDDGTDVVSVRFSTQNFEGDAEGYLWAAGSQVGLEWMEGGQLVGQAHIPISDA